MEGNKQSAVCPASLDYLGKPGKYHRFKLSVNDHPILDRPSGFVTLKVTSSLFGRSGKETLRLRTGKATVADGKREIGFLVSSDGLFSRVDAIQVIRLDSGQGECVDLAPAVARWNKKTRKWVITCG